MIYIHHGQVCGRVMNDKLNKDKNLEYKLVRHMEKERDNLKYLASQVMILYE